MQNYVNGNKANNNEEGVFPDDTRDAFDNPRIRVPVRVPHTRCRASRSASSRPPTCSTRPRPRNAVHTSARGNGTGIVDQFLDDRHRPDSAC